MQQSINLIEFHETQFIHYSQILDSKQFKNEDHLRFLKEQKTHHLNRFLDLTQTDDSVMIAAGIKLN